MKATALLIVIFSFFHPQLRSQNTGKENTTDSSKTTVLDKKKVYSHARKATLMSVFLPGLGQGYNKKYWKIPIIYAGLGGFTYMFITNNQQYNYYRDNLKAIYDEDPATVNTTIYQDWQLESLKTQYKKNRDFAVIGFFAVYLLNIIDANVDGHLMSFDVSDDLGLQLDPWYNLSPGNKGLAFGSAGMSLKLNFK